MEIISEIIPSLLGMLAGGGLTGLVAWRAYRRKANGEATQTEADAMKSVQDVYQQTIADLKDYNQELRMDRNHLRQDRNEIRQENEELRKRQNDIDDKVRKLEREVDWNRHILEKLSPFLCGRLKCLDRTKVDLGNSDGEERKEGKRKTEQASRSSRKANLPPSTES